MFLPLRLHLLSCVAAVYSHYSYLKPFNSVEKQWKGVLQSYQLQAAPIMGLRSRPLTIMPSFYWKNRTLQNIHWDIEDVKQSL